MKIAAKRKVRSKTRTTKTSSKHHKKTKKIAIVVSLFNEKICRNLLQGSLKELTKNGYATKDIKTYEVAGAFEIPLIAKKIAQTKKFGGIIALGCVIRGDTPHFEYVSLAATMGCLQAGLETECPIAFGVLTVDNEMQAIERSQPNKFNKGREASLALLDTLNTLESV